MKLIYNLLLPPYTLYKWVAKLLGYTDPLRANLGPWAVIALAWFILGGTIANITGVDPYDYSNDIGQAVLTIFGIIWFLFGAYLVVGIHIHKLRQLQEYRESRIKRLK